MKPNHHPGNALLLLLTKHGVYAALLILVIFFSLANRQFCTFDNLLLILQQASPLGIAVVGMVFVLLVAGIDISVGRSMFLISTLIGFLGTIGNEVLGAWLNHSWGLGLILSLVVIMGGLIGLLNGVLVTRWHMLPFIVTLATGSIMRGVGLKLSGSASLNMPPALVELANGRVGSIPIVVVLFIAIVVIFDYVLRHTQYGRHLMAIGASAKNANRAGIRVDRNVTIAYIVCGVLAAIGGILSAGQIGSVAAGFGEGNEFIVISAAVLGGTSLFGGKGSIFPGAVIGIILITTIMNGLAMMNASPFVYTIAKGFVIFSAIAIDSIRHRGELR